MADNMVARATATLSLHTGVVTPPNPTKLLRTSLSHAQSLSFPDHKPFFSHHHSPTLHKSPNIIICHGKLDGSASEQAEEIGEVFFDDNDLIAEDGDEDETESSIDLLVRFLHSMFKKLSKRAKKATRSMLPGVISPQLVSFAVDGILLLAALSIVKAFLEVVCTLGSSVFAAVLLLRVTWAAISYFQSSGSTFNQGGSSFGTT